MPRCALVLLLALLPLPSAAAEDCHLALAGAVAMTVHGGSVSVPMTIAGKPLDMLVDTGGIYSMLTDDVAKSLGLKRYRADTTTVSMWGGGYADQYVTARDVTLGALQTSRMSFLVMPNGRLDEGESGILAPDVLRAYDVDFDFAAGRFSLFSPEHCPGKVVYWADAWSQIPFDIDDYGQIRLPVTLDGHAVTMTLDTGSDDTVMSLELARSLFGFDDTSPRLTRVETEDGTAAYRYAFATLAFGGVTVSHPDIILVPDSVSHVDGPGRALLGIGVLRRLHLYIAYREKMLYVTAAETRR